MPYKPIIAISTGDPSGIGAEISIKALKHSVNYEICRPFLIGDVVVLSGFNLGGFRINKAVSVKDMLFEFGTIDVLDLNLFDSIPPIGEVNKISGKASFQYVKKAIEMALNKQVDAIVTAPINKEAINMAGYKFSGHTEIFAHFTNSKDYAMMLAHDHFRVIHVSTHVSLRDACEKIKKQRILQVIKLADEACKKLAIIRPKIGVAGLNPHAGENGLFGREEIEEIVPAIREALKLGIDVEGPIPPDTIFPKLNSRLYDICVCMYHDQGHIPIKLLGFKWNDKEQQWDSVSGVNITVGLPIIRVSVDHGTAFDIAGKGIASDASMTNAVHYAAQLTKCQLNDHHQKKNKEANSTSTKINFSC